MEEAAARMSTVTGGGTLSTIPMYLDSERTTEKQTGPQGSHITTDGVDRGTGKIYAEPSHRAGRNT